MMHDQAGIGSVDIHYKHEAIEDTPVTDEEFIKALEREYDELTKLRDEVAAYRRRLPKVDSVWGKTFYTFGIRRIEPGSEQQCAALLWPCPEDARFEIRTEGPPAAHAFVCSTHIGQTIMRFVPVPT